MDIIMHVGGSAMAEWRISLNIYRPQEIESEMAKKETPFEVSFAIDLENKVNGKIVGKSNRKEITPVESIGTSFKRGSSSWPWKTFNKLGNFIKFHPSSFCILAANPATIRRRRSESQAGSRVP